MTEQKKPDAEEVTEDAQDSTSAADETTTAADAGSADPTASREEGANEAPEDRDARRLDDPGLEPPDGDVSASVAEPDPDPEPEPKPDPESEPQEAPEPESKSPSSEVEPVAEQAPIQAPVAKPKGRVLATFAFLFAITAVGGVAYLYYLLVYLQPLDSVRAQNAALGTQYADMESRLQAQMQELQTASSAALDAAISEQAERLAGNEAAVLKSLNEALSAAPPSQREWKLAEAEYLLRIANHRVLMEQDSVGALALLQAADQILAEIDDFSLYQVRARLADEIIALRQVPRDDLQGLYLRIEALKGELDDLPLPTPAYLQAEAAADPERTVWETLLEELKQFIRVRSLASDEAIKPLLAPEEERYLELNLRLALEQAQLATLKRQQEVYTQSLQTVRRWLVDHADLQDPRAQALLASVDELLIVELAIPLPEISGSLNELLSLRRSGS